jgi:hypothetical protein
MSIAQFSLHCYRDAVKFFIACHNQTSTYAHQQTVSFDSQHVVSGGDGYIDLRLNQTLPLSSPIDRHQSHLIVWQLELN